MSRSPNCARPGHATGSTGYGDDIISGVGTTEPRGLLLDAATGVTGPTGTGTSLGTRGTVNQGTDALWNLIGSVAEPYAAAPTSAFLMRNASDVIVRKPKDTTGQPVAGLTERCRILGYPSFVDPFMPAMASAVESIAFGDMSKYFIRLVNGGAGLNRCIYAQVGRVGLEPTTGGL
jgi:HK97 family phage major capsid protein